MTPTWSCTGAVLVGGAGTRMGESKTQVRLPDGRRMIEPVIQALEMTCGEVIVVGGAEPGYRHLADRRSGAGPLAGVETVLASNIDSNYLICPADLPLVTPGLLSLLAVESTAAATIFDVPGSGRIQSLPMRISIAATPAVTDALDAGQNAIHSLLGRLEYHLVPISERQAIQLLNVNTPEALSVLERVIREPDG